MDKKLVKISKFISLVLRHEPQAIGLTLDEHGWVSVADLLERSNKAGVPINRDLLNEIVETNDKKRFAFSADSTKIRANQGHSVEIDLALPPQIPPELLYHGTATRFVESIRAEGLNPRARQHVHLSRDEATALKVGQRHGTPVVLTVRAGDMQRAGRQFFCSENGVWLTENVPPEYITIPF